ncbi:MAG TPA: LacI family DNA-binding transcriptional regulator [Bryobacteraceae bacterium]|nr:LacI family DNA-binding transcriptional regulator [Bryobacteraceae bacterium]
MKKQTRFKDVAKAANVSPATVSRVAKGLASVDPGIRARVEKTANQLGVDLEKKRGEKPNIIGFMLANRDLVHNFQARILFGSEAYCASREKELLFMSHRYPASVPSKELHLPKVLKQGIVQAMILGGTNSRNMLTALKERGIPFAVLGNNVLGDTNGEEYDAVYSDDVQGAYDLTTQLAGEGHRHIWFVGDISLPWYERCSQGYRRAMTQAGLEPKMSEIHSDDRQLGYLATRSILSRREPMTAIFAGSDQIARGVYEAVRQAGLRIPEDVSVAGFNDSEAALMDPPLTSVQEFPEELGKHLAEFVLRRLDTPTLPPQRLTIPTRVVGRRSTRGNEPGRREGVRAMPSSSKN